MLIMQICSKHIGVIIMLTFSLMTAGWAANPIVNTMFTADPAALVYNDSLFVFTGHDEQGPEGPGNDWFSMRDWHVFVTNDMVNYHDYGAVLKPQIFSWASGNAFAGHCEFRNGKFYWYVAVSHRTIKEDEGFSIGVAVADHPSGPWKDAIGSALITDKTPNDIALNIDPAIYIDNGTAWLYWGSWSAARRVKLKDNMIQLDGGVETVNATGFFEAPWIHKYRGNYYFSYASGFPSTTNYSISSSINGPWQNKGVLNPLLNNSNTNHQAIVKYLGHWFFIYHGANRDGGWTYRRSVNIDYLYYDKDANMVQIKRTSTGVDKVDNSLLKAGVYRLRMVHSNMVLQDANGVVVQQDKSDGDDQLWKLVPSSQNKRYYSLVNIGTQRSLCAGSVDVLDTLKTSVSECEMRIENASVEKGYFLFTNYENDFVADVLDVSTVPGMPVITWVRTGADNQKIQLEWLREIGTVDITTHAAESVGGLNYQPEMRIVELGTVANWQVFSVSGALIQQGSGQKVDLNSFKTGVYIVKSRNQFVVVFRD